MADWMNKGNLVAALQNFLFAVCWILQLARPGFDAATDLASATVSWSNVYYFLAWYLHYQFNFVDTKSNKSGQYGFNQVLTILNAVIVFNYWGSFNSTGVPAADVVIGVFQTITLITYVLDDLVGIFADVKILS